MVPQAVLQISNKYLKQNFADRTLLMRDGDLIETLAA